MTFEHIILAAADNGGGGIAQTFGLDWPKFLAQCLIFFLVYKVLEKKAFGPIQAMLLTRRERIAEGEANLEKIKKDLAAAESTSQGIVDKANGDATRLVAEAKTSAAALSEAERQKASAEAAQIIAKGREATEAEKKSQLAELKKEFGRLVVDATSKVSGKVLSDSDQERINQETANQVAL